MEKLGDTLTTSMNQSSTLEPEPLVCEFCNTQLRYRPLENPLTNKVWMWLKPFRCECDRAKEYWAKVDEEQKRQEQEKLRQKIEMELKQKINRVFKSSNLPERFLTRTFNNFIQTDQNAKAYQKSLEYAENFQQGKGLLFNGTVGTGKTHLAAAISINLLNKGTSVIFGTVTTLLGKIKQSYNDANYSERDVLEQLINCTLLVIDDLGKEKPTEWVEQMLYEIINSRYENNKSLIITTNTNLKEIQEIYDKNGPAIVSRIIEMCQGIKMDGIDFRIMRLK